MLDLFDKFEPVRNVTFTRTDAPAEAMTSAARNNGYRCAQLIYGLGNTHSAQCPSVIPYAGYGGSGDRNEEARDVMDGFVEVNGEVGDVMKGVIEVNGEVGDVMKGVVEVNEEVGDVTKGAGEGSEDVDDIMKGVVEVI